MRKLLIIMRVYSIDKRYIVKALNEKVIAFSHHKKNIQSIHNIKYIPIWNLENQLFVIK